MYLCVIMNSIWITLIIALIVVAFMLIGLALTRIIKGKDLQSDVGNNDHMKGKGLVCAAKQFRDEEKSVACGEDPSCGDCGSCSVKLDK